jgi:thiol-disulfide isomerase/thioredoxin
MKQARLISAFLAAIFGAAVLLAGPSGPARGDGKSAAADPPRTGGMQQFTLYTPPLPVPDIPFLDPSGKEARLADLKGQVVLVNFWATWCAPCIRELPSLDRLQAEMGGKDFTVLAINEDRTGAAVAGPFLEKHGWKNLGVNVDRQLALSRAMGVRGMPSTFILNRTGQVMGVLTGPAEWDSPDAKALIRHYIDAGG